MLTSASLILVQKTQMDLLLFKKNNFIPGNLHSELQDDLTFDRMPETTMNTRYNSEIISEMFNAGRYSDKI